MGWESARTPLEEVRFPRERDFAGFVPQEAHRTRHQSLKSAAASSGPALFPSAVTLWGQAICACRLFGQVAARKYALFQGRNKSLMSARQK